VDIIEVAGLMFSHTTKHHPTVPDGITIQQGETITPTLEKPATPAHIKHIDLIATGRIYF